MSKLNDKQERFCEEYIVDLNAAAAAIRAGYAEKAARQVACRLLTQVNIQAKINELKGKRAERTAITADAVLQELAVIGFSDMDDFGRIIELFEEREQEPGEGEDEEKEAETYVRKIVDFFPSGRIPKHKKRAILALKQTRDGIELKLHDKVKALELMGRHLGIFERDNSQKKPDSLPMTDEQVGKLITALKGK